MTTIIWTTAAALMFIAVIATHEAGHALALRRYGIPITEAGLGLPYGPRLVFEPTRRRPFSLSISLLLVGAYVVPDENHAERMEALPYIDQAWWAGAGIVVNAVTGCTLGAILAAAHGHWVLAPVLTTLALALAVWPRQFCAYAVPVLSVPVLGFLLWSLALTVGQPSGPVGVGRALDVSAPSAAVSVTAGIALSLAMLNMIPVFPFDGGRIVRLLALRWGGRRGDRVFRAAGTVLALGLVGYLVLGDVWWVVAG